ncbi:hypothetical protein KFL_005140030 [Klebsormidium nitens]|uniref:Uncharacterized protein n=1 Tax=Klebsormidium nitens TaxID=105231 RepID=A0A1Y1IIV3_KLENI|nr:hypothetical protein KFL_005140030 [Klebsormidium nitens]|eukprot:GAQ89359.1 hypothetical protein KFL_005140030 [Klebsormidium nitens]
MATTLHQRLRRSQIVSCRRRSFREQVVKKTLGRLWCILLMQPLRRTPKPRRNEQRLLLETVTTASHQLKLPMLIVVRTREESFEQIRWKLRARPGPKTQA